MTTVDILVFANLKEFYQPTFKLTVAENTVQGIRTALLKENPTAAALLSACRFAVNERFVSNDYILQENETIAILPPSSGG